LARASYSDSTLTKAAPCTFRASTRQWHLMAVMRVASASDSPLGSLSRLGAVLRSMPRTKDGSSRETLCLTSNDSFSFAPNATVHSLSSSNVIFSPFDPLVPAAGSRGKDPLRAMIALVLHLIGGAT